jgi:arylsulfatase A-like enzyme
MYPAMMACMDDAIKNITNAFKEAELWDNTILVFTAGTYTTTSST